MEKRHREILRRNRVFLLDNIDSFDRLLSELLAAEMPIVNEGMVDSIQPYKMESKPRGLALILSNTRFGQESKLEDRPGGEIDFDNVQSLLDRLGFHVETGVDKSAEGMLSILKTFAAKEEHKSADACIVVLMSHGAEDQICGTDGEMVKYSNIFEAFNNKNCPNLQGKPKLFFIQACRGSAVDKGTDDPDSGKMQGLLGPKTRGTDQADAIKGSVPTKSDMLFSYATQKGQVSFRNSEYGSWYIQTLTKVFMEHAKDRELSSLLRMVNRFVSQKSASCPQSPEYHGGKECCEFVDTLMKDFYFFPGTHT
uniref:Uncharacterized protein n=1 Tax=Branchiostoma floridae TaxID=7739 RepID=C3XPS9_BRAFL|eukprot:XP_002613941.1 hypothetical protein BRAFLDRAFT_67496 [Branchiostoma floridae]